MTEEEIENFGLVAVLIYREIELEYHKQGKVAGVKTIMPEFLSRLKKQFLNK
jgi:hypothetical protein